MVTEIEIEIEDTAEDGKTTLTGNDRTRVVGMRILASSGDTDAAIFRFLIGWFARFSLLPYHQGASFFSACLA